MAKVVNPFNRSEQELDTTAHICDCICNVQLDNNDSGIWTSRLTFNLVCGCACNSKNKDNNNAKDKDR